MTAADAGLEGIVAGRTSICTLAGDMLYRGYAIEDLAAGATFEEVVYLLLHGELPTREQLEALRARWSAAAQLPGAVLDTLRKIPATAPLMDVLRTGCSLLAHFDPEVNDESAAAVRRKAERLTAQLPLVLSTAVRLRRGRDVAEFDPAASTATNLLSAIRDRAPDAEEARALDVSLVLYGEHEFNASTFTARVVASTLSDLHSAVTAAIGALKGRLHGGANERVLDVLRAAEADGDPERWIRRALDRKERVMGFGHRVYKDFDPRARILKPWCEKLARRSGRERDETAADVIERIIRERKGLPANVDWPSGRLYDYLGLPVETYTPLFVCARVAGWSAHVLEQQSDNRIIRPAAEYAGPPRRPFVPLLERR